MVHYLGKKFLQIIWAFQARHSKVSTTPFLRNDEFPFIHILEDNWREIREELEQVLKQEQDIPAFHQISPDQARISKGTDWKTFALLVLGVKIDQNRAQCPRTSALLDSIPNLQNAWFSILAPHYHIPPHKGPTKALVRCHLGLRVPQAWERCWIRVDDQKYNWREGKVVMFDDTFEHEVLNDTDEQRVVLFLDVDRPTDNIGALFNRWVLRLIKSSHYFKDPLRNLAAWNRQHPPQTMDLKNLH
ncbi:MAG: aspartyl/asparaginyl beta-hydroxylase domain-containing protein [Gammaproteobacteria bacterium]|nr:aspartyl/asparaginyl beta-hydroxylase domain-containing protein [Gammaproteobacteria bacterium]